MIQYYRYFKEGNIGLHKAYHWTSRIKELHLFLLAFCKVHWENVSFRERGKGIKGFVAKGPNNKGLTVKDRRRREARRRAG